MSAQEILAAYRRSMDEVGEDIIVRRYTGVAPSRVSHDTTTRARVMGYQPKDLVGAIVQGDRKVIALVDTLSAVLPLKTSDKLVIRGLEVSIKAVDDNSRRIGGVLIALEITAAG